MALPKPQLPLRAEPLPLRRHDTIPCPICGQAWQPFGGTRLPCHARCLYDEAGQDVILELSEGGAGDKNLVRALGVTHSVLRATLKAALARRGTLVRRSAP